MTYPAEKDAVAWRHCRWFDPHPPAPVAGSEGPVRATGGRLGAVCATCGEALTSDVIPPAEGSETVGGMARAEWDERMRTETALAALPDETTCPIPPEGSNQ